MRAVVWLTAVLVAAQLARAAGSRGVPGPGDDGRYRKWEDDAVMIEVHRSMRFREPENSLAAARQCYLAGGDAVDCDVRATLDGVTVCFHDSDPSWRGTGSIYPVSQLTWSEAAEVPIEPLSYPPGRQTLARFEDVLRHAIANNMAIYIDPKDPTGHANARRLLTRYGAGHLKKLPRWPLVYYWTTRGDHDIALLAGLLKAERAKDIRAKKTVVLPPGSPRSLRVDDPRILAALVGRKPANRGPWRPPVAEMASKPRSSGRSPAQLHQAMAAGGKPGRLASHELCSRFPAEARDIIRAGVKDAQAPRELQIEYLWSIGQLKDPKAMVLLTERLESKDARIRELAAYGLGRMPWPRAADRMLQAAGDADPTAAGAAAWALWRFADPKTAGPALAVLQRRLANYKDGDHLPVRMLLLALGQLKCPRIVPLIDRHMAAKAQAPNVNVAIAALGAVGGPKAVAVAEKLFAAHGRAAQSGLFCRAMVVAGKAGTPALVRAMAGGNRELSMDATLTLMDVPDAVEALGPAVKAAGLSARGKTGALAVLAVHADPAAKALLRVLAGDADKAVAEQARWALKRR